MLNGYSTWLAIAGSVLAGAFTVGGIAYNFNNRNVAHEAALTQHVQEQTIQTRKLNDIHETLKAIRCDLKRTEKDQLKCFQQLTVEGGHQ